MKVSFMAHRPSLAMAIAKSNLDPHPPHQDASAFSSAETPQPLAGHRYQRGEKTIRRGQESGQMLLPQVG